MKSIEDLKQALTAINETAFQGLNFNHRPIQQLITELGRPDKPDPKPQIDKIQAAMGLFLKTSHLESFQDIRRVSYGAAIPLGHDQMRLIEKKDHFLKLLDMINHYQSRPRIFRRLYRGLLSSYFNYDPEASYAKDAGPDHWQYLRRYLDDHINGLQTEDINPDWVVILHEHRNLLTNDPCSRYAEALLDGASDAFEEAGRQLGFYGTSWVTRAVVNARIDAAIRRPDNEFKLHLSELLKLLQHHATLLNAGLAKLLERYAKTQPLVIHHDLCNFAVEHWKNPWLPMNQSRWSLVSEFTREMVDNWLKHDLVKNFFELLSADGSNDTRRLDFWIRYVNHIKIYFALGKYAMENQEPSFRVLRQKMDGILMKLHGGGSKENNAFIMDMGDHTFVEFGMPGHAVYIYSSQQMPFKLQGAYEISLNTLKDTQCCIDRWQHRNNIHDYSDWESRFNAHLYLNYGIKVSNENELPEPWASSSYYTTCNPSTLNAFCQAFKLRTEDSRPSGGYLWIQTDDNNSMINRQLRAWSFTYRAGRGWFSQVD